MQNQSEQVNCPICNISVDETEINYHLDHSCSSQSTKTPATTQMAPLFNNSKTQNVAEHSTQAHVPATSLTPTASESQPTRMAPLFRSPTKPLTASSLKTSPQQQQQQRQQQHPVPPQKHPLLIDNSPAPISTSPSKRQRRDAATASMPLAAKVRPSSLNDFVGQQELIGKGGVLRTLIENDRIPSMILWGGPGCGKTTLARIISNTTKSRFVELSATSHGAADVKKAFDEAKGHLSLSGQRTIVFIDEIHRFTKVQQDLFLPYVEQGQIRLIGATTENPSFKVNAALLSRCRVFVLKQLSTDEIIFILTRALKRWRSQNDDLFHEKHQLEYADETKIDDEDNMDKNSSITLKHVSEKDAISFLANYSDGDARNALNTLEIALSTLPSKNATLEVDTIKGAFQKSHLLYDRNGEEHYNIISALHKSIRGSDPDAGLYWLGRMMEAGEDPLYIARRLVRMASEDIGLADNAALPLAVAAYTSVEKLGRPECDTALAQTVVYLAETKKSIRVYKAYNQVKQVIKTEPSHPVPLHIRNAPTKLMKDIGYGDGYKYNPDFDGPVDQTYLPDALVGRRFLDDD